MPKLIVILAFDYDDEGNLVEAIEPQEASSEAAAINRAKRLAEKHAGVVAWSREADPDLGDYGDSVELFRAGDVGEID